MKNYEDIFELIDSGCDYEEAVREIETRRGLDYSGAIEWMKSQAIDYVDGAPDASRMEKEAGRIVEWCNGAGTRAKIVAEKRLDATNRTLFEPNP